MRLNTSIFKFKKSFSVSFSCLQKKVNVFFFPPAFCLLVSPFIPRTVFDFYWCLCVRGDVGRVSTARENKQVICWMLSDSPQKACPSQSSAQHPTLTLPHSALPDNVTGHDSDELRWRSTLADVYSGGLVKGSETHTECCLFWLCKDSNPITRRYGFVCDSS